LEDEPEIMQALTKNTTTRMVKIGFAIGAVFLLVSRKNPPYITAAIPAM
jgi:hypothetical protein